MIQMEEEGGGGLFRYQFSLRLEMAVEATLKLLYSYDF
jgi:hypothetical protein